MSFLALAYSLTRRIRVAYIKTARSFKIVAHNAYHMISLTWLSHPLASLLMYMLTKIPSPVSWWSSGNSDISARLDSRANVCVTLCHVAARLSLSPQVSCPHNDQSGAATLPSHDHCTMYPDFIGAFESNTWTSSGSLIADWNPKRKIGSRSKLEIRRRCEFSPT